MVEPSSSPQLVRSADSTADPELLQLPRPPRQGRTVALSLLIATAVMALLMTAALASDVRYALTRAEPEDVGDLVQLTPDADLSNRFVRGSARLDYARTVQYERRLEADSFRLSPIAGNDNIWIEMRIPAGLGSPEVLASATFVGRLLPLDHASFRYRGLGRSIRDASAPRRKESAWVLVDGATPASSRWTVALAALFSAFAAYSLVTVARIVWPARRG